MSRRVPPNEVCSFMEQITVKQQITSLGVIGTAPKIAPTKEQLQHYLNNPPAGKIHVCLSYL